MGNGALLLDGTAGVIDRTAKQDGFPTIIVIGFGQRLGHRKTMAFPRPAVEEKAAGTSGEAIRAMIFPSRPAILSTRRHPVKLPPGIGGAGMRKALRIIAAVLLAVAAVSTGWVALYRVVPPPVTPLMLIRAADGAGIARDWVPLDSIAPALVTAVIAAEDTRFCGHSGFDWAAIQDALDDNGEGGPVRGGSTISQQTAKNAFLWPGRTWVRKGAEAGFTVLMEALWPKRRVMEVYLNVIEWGDGLYGAEAAAQAWFHKPAAALTRREAALLAVVLPNPRRWSPAAPTPFIARRAGIIETRMGVVRRQGLDGCATGG